MFASNKQRPSAARQNFHWPVFERIVGPDMTERSLLGLPEHSIKTRQIFSSQIFLDVCSQSPEKWPGIVEDPKRSSEERFAAGSLLAIAGDPRIDTFSPTMCYINGQDVLIGLEISKLNSAIESMDGLGVSRDWILKEVPRHSVKLQSYFIGQYPVTNREFYDYLLDTGAEDTPTSWEFGIFPITRANHPVYTIEAEAAERYCTWLSRRTGRIFRLPSESAGSSSTCTAYQFKL